MADAAAHAHADHDTPGFFTRWFMSTNHKDIGILYMVTAATLGLVAVAFYMFMRLELLKLMRQEPAIERDPRNQSADDCDRRRIGGQDERGMRAEIHRDGRTSACSISMVRSRRRKISFRMAARCSASASSVNATSMAIRGTRIEGWIVDPPRRNTEAG